MKTCLHSLFPLLISVGLLLICLRAGNAEAASFSRARPLMGTLVEISVEAESRKVADAVMDEAFEEIVRVDALMSGFKKESEVSLLKHHAGERPVRISPMLMEVLQAGVSYYFLSGGAFDMTVGPLMKLWSFRGGPERVPSGEEITRVRSFVGSDRMVLNSSESSAYLPVKGMEIDLGGIAKGYAVDRAVKALRSGGISHAVVNAGGDLFVLGSSRCPEGVPVGVRDPVNRGGLLGWVRVRDAAVATSGSYENFFVRDGKGYTHIIDPRDGYPVQRVLSVSVRAPSAMQADALATALFVLGSAEGLKLAESLRDVEALIVSSDGEGSGLSLAFTSGFSVNESSPPPAECLP